RNNTDGRVGMEEESLRGGPSLRYISWELIPEVVLMRSKAAAFIVGLTIVFAPIVGLAADAKDARSETRAWADRPERGVPVYTEFSPLAVPIGQTVRMALT